MSPAPDLRALVHGARTRLRRRGALAAALGAAAAAPLGLVAAWLWAGEGGWVAPHPGPLLLWAAAAALAMAVGIWGIRRWVVPVDEARVAAAAEESRGLPAGSLRGVLELGRGVPEGVSGALYRRARDELARRVGDARPGELSGSLERAAGLRQRRLGAGVAGFSLVALTLGMVSPERSRAAWAPLLAPVRMLSAPPLPPILLSPGDAAVPRGDSLPVAVSAPGRSRVTLGWRAEGDLPRQARIPLSGGAGEYRLGPVDAPILYWATAPDGAVSDTFRLEPTDPLLVSSLRVEVEYPAYLGREADRFEGDVPPLALPQGSRLRIRGEATSSLASVELEGGGSTVELSADGPRFGGVWVPRRGGVYAWNLRDVSGRSSTAPPTPLELELVPDETPTVEVSFPGRDTLLGPEMRQPLVIQAGDDHGLAGARVVSRRVGMLGARDEPVSEPLPLDGRPERVLLRSVLDAAGRGLLPGDALEYHVEVTDNSPGAQVGRSRTFVLRMPSTAEIRELARAEARSLANDASEVSRAAGEMERQTRDLQRRLSGSSSAAAEAASRPDAGRPGQREGRPSLDYQRAEEARRVLERQEELVRALEGLEKRTEALRRAAEEAGLNDPEMQRRLAELRELLDQAVSPELRSRMEQLRQALDELDPAELEDALGRLAEEQDRFREQVEQTMELLRRAAVEQQMRVLAQEARETAMQQEALAETLQQLAGDSAGAPRPAPGETAPPPITPEETGQPRPGANRRGEAPTPADSLAGQGSRTPGDTTGARGANPEEPRDSATGPDDSAAAAGDSGRAAVDSSGSRPPRPAPGQDPAGADTREKNPRNAGSETADSTAGGEESRDGSSEKAAAAPDSASDSAGAQGRRLPRLPKPPNLSVASRQQEEVARRGSEVSRALSELREQLSALGESQAAGQTGEAGSKAQEGAESMEQAGKQARSGDAQGAAEQGARGAARMGEAADALERTQTAMTEAWKTEVQEALQRATQDALSLAQREQALLDQMQEAEQQSGGASQEQMAGMRGEQAAVQQGLEALGRNLSDAGRRTAAMSQDVGTELGRATLSVQRSLNAMSGEDNAARMPVGEAQGAVDALNRLALSLLQSAQQAGQSQSATGLQEALDALARAAEAQGRLNGQASGLMPLEVSPEAMTRQLSELSGRQREIARQLDGIGRSGGAEDPLLGRVDALAEEADRIARELGGGRLTTETLARQERLFHRLLDAGRTLEKEEFTEERSAERPGATGSAEVGPLDARLLEGGPRFPPPDAEQLRALPPAYRRLILEYFDRLNRPATPPAESAPTPEGGRR